MSYRKQVTFFCDKCGEWVRINSDSALLVRKILKTWGWKYDKQNFKDYCPKCEIENE